MYLNTFAQGLGSVDLANSEEVNRVLLRAVELGLPHPDRARVTARNLVVNGLRLHTMEWGDQTARPLVLVHGGNQSAHTWDLVSLSLSSRFHVVAYDQRGHGDSEWPRDGSATMGDRARDLREVIRVLGLRRPALAGIGMGGLVCMTAVLQDPALEVDRVVTVGGGPRLANQGVQEVRAFVSAIGEYDSVDEFVRGVVEYDSYKSEVHTRQTAGFNVMQRVDGKFVSKHDRRRYEGRSHTQSNDSALTLEECQLIRCPVLVIRGEDSRVLTDELATQLSRHFPNGQLKTVPSAGHNVHSQNTSGFLAALEPFLG